MPVGGLPEKVASIAIKEAVPKGAASFFSGGADEDEARPEERKYYFPQPKEAFWCGSSGSVSPLTKSQHGFMTEGTTTMNLNYTRIALIAMTAAASVISVASLARASQFRSAEPPTVSETADVCRLSSILVDPESGKTIRPPYEARC